MDFTATCQKGNELGAGFGQALVQTLFEDAEQPMLLFDLASLEVLHTNAALEGYPGLHCTVGQDLRAVVGTDFTDQLAAMAEDATTELQVDWGAGPEAVSLRKLGQDAPWGLFSIKTNQAAREAELALRASETRFRVIAEHCPAMVAIFQDGKIVFVNDRVGQCLGYSRDEIMGRTFTEIVHPEHRELVQERNAQRMQGLDVPSRYEFKLETKNGFVRWIDFSAGIFEYEGKPAVLGIAMDITERRSTEERLRQREVELAHVARLTTMGEMVAGIAHEINQPLSAISNYSDACTVELSRLEGVDQIRNWTERISQQAVRCGDIIRRLRAYVRQKQMDESDVRLNDVVQESIALLRNEIQNTVQVDCELAGPSPVVSGNAVELQQVVVNLLSNAHEAITHSGQSGGKLLVRCRYEGDHALVDVEDNGPGLDEQNMDRIYEAFYTTRSEGMGMGLAISRSIVERHGGRLWAKNIHPQGAAFHIELPIKRGDRRVIG